MENILTQLNSKRLIFANKKVLPLILQDEISECGLACIGMISNYLGHDIDLYSLRQLAGSSIKGTSILNLISLCDRLSLNTKVLRIELKDLRSIKYPAILHWNLNHFVVLKKIKNNKIIIHDPALGVRKPSLNEVSECFTGIVLEVQKKDSFQAVKAKNKLSLIDLYRNTKGLNNVIVVLMLLSLVIEVLGLINPLFMQYITDKGLETEDSHTLMFLGFGLCLASCLLIFSEYIRSRYVLFVKNNLNEQFSSSTILHILSLPITYFEKRHKGDIQSRYQSIDQIQRKMSTDFVNTLIEGFILVITLSLMFFYSALLSTIVLASFFIFLLITYASYSTLKKLTNESLQLHAQSSSYFLETLQGILAIKTFGKERSRFNLWHNNYIRSLNADIKISRVEIICSTFKKLLSNLEHVLLICVGSNLIIKNQFSIGMLVAYLAYRLHFINKATLFIQNLFDFKLISVHLARLSDILLQKAEEARFNKSIPEEDLKGELLLDNLSFNYENEEKSIFENFNLKIYAGEKIVITGVSGCGKTTLLKVMMGLLKPSTGEIYIDGFSLRQFGLKNYRNVTAAVMQEDILLRGSILQNISFFDEAVDLNNVYQSAKNAQIHEEILKLPMGYETLVGDMAIALSGGQKQRILLARALYKKPKILFLDEATSHLDVENEKKINQILRNLSITQIVIAHRQETINMADRVIQI